MPSKRTKPVTFRLPKEVVAIVERRAKKQGLKLSEYLRKFVTYDALRRR